MKKRFLLILCGLLIFTTAAGCGKDDVYAKYRDSVSELRNVYQYGESEHFEVEICAGKREEPFRADGIVNDTERFFLVLVYPKMDMERKDVSVSFEADRMYQAKLFRNPAFDSYAYDFGEVERVPANFNLEISCENLIEEVTMLHASEDVENTSDDILKKGVDLFHEKEDWQQRELEGFEIGIRLVRDRERGGKLCWHFLMIFRDGTVWGKIFPTEVTTENPVEQTGGEAGEIGGTAE